MRFFSLAENQGFVRPYTVQIVAANVAACAVFFVHMRLFKKQSVFSCLCFCPHGTAHICGVA